MIEEITAMFEPIMPYSSYIIMSIFAIIIIWKSNFFKAANKLSKESPSTKVFFKEYAKISMILLKSVQWFLIKYAMYLAFYGFIISNVYLIAGFEVMVIFGFTLVLARVQLKKFTVKPDEDYTRLRKKYLLTRKMLDEQLKGKE